MNPIQRGARVCRAKNQRARDDPVGAGVCQQGDGLTTNPAVDDNLGTSTRPAAKLQNGANALSGIRVKPLSLHPNFGTHDKEAIDKVKMEIVDCERIAYFDHQTRADTS